MNKIVSFFDELFARISCKRTAFVVMCALVVVGIVLGVVLYMLPSAAWWQNNRYAFADKLLYGGFGGVLGALLLPTVLLCAVAVVGCAVPQCRFLLYLSAFLCGLYVGATVSAIASMSVVACVLYVLLWSTVEVASALFLLGWCVVEQPCKKDVKNALWLTKPILLAFCVVFLVKIILIFVVLRTIIGLI